MKCPNCGSELSEQSTECLSCGLILAKWREKHERAEASALGKSSFEKALAASRVAQKVHERRAELAAWLLVPSSPILLPSLALNAFAARFLSRKDFLVLVASALFLGLLSWGSLLLKSLVFLSFLGSAALWRLRQGGSPYGVFLGYSMKVLRLLVVAGGLAAVGCGQLFPWRAWGRLERVLFAREIKTSGAALLKKRSPSPRHVTLDGDRIDWSLRTYRVKTGWSQAFYPQSPETVLEFASPKELWEARHRLMGTRVRLTQLPRLDRTLVVPHARYIRCPTCAPETDFVPRHYSMMSGTMGNVWITSEEPAVSTDSAGGVSGTLVQVWNDGELQREAWAVAGRSVHGVGVALRQDLAPSLVEPETWAPVAGTGGGVWLRWPGFIDSASEDSLAGIYVGADSAPSLRDYAIHQSFLSPPGRIHTVLVMDRQDYAVREGLLGAFTRGFDWRHSSLFLLLSLPFFGAAILSARKE